MSDTMYDYIFEQPEALRRVFEYREEDGQTFVKQYSKVKPKRVYLIGSGSSLNAAKAAAPVMEKMLKVEVTPAASSAIPKLWEENVFLIFISQGGNSTNTVQAIQQYSRYPHIALTGMETCAVNAITDHVLIRCGEEKAGPKTKGYVSTFFLLCCLGLEAGRESGSISEEEYQKAVFKGSQAIGRMKENIQIACSWFEKQAEEMKKIEKCVCVGKHMGRAAALESALKLQETLLIPASGYEYEEFLHGPDMALDEKMAGLYLLPEQTDPDYERFVGLVTYHRSKSPYVYTVGGGPEFDTDKDLKIGGEDSEEWKLFSWCLPSQIMGARIPSLVGKEGKGHIIFEELDEILTIKAKEQK